MRCLSFRNIILIISMCLITVSANADFFDKLKEYWNSNTKNITKTTSHEKDILGIWYLEITQPGPDGLLISVKGTSEYLKNGGSNFVGQYQLSIPEGDYTYLTTYNATISGEWLIDEDSLVEKIIDIKSYPVLMQRGQEKIDLRKNAIKGLPKLENFVPKGMSAKSQILDMTNNRMILSIPNGQGEEIEVLAKRVNKPFKFEN